MLRNNFVCGYKNIMQEGYAGDSGVHPINGTAVNTTNGAGPHNLQTFVLAPDGTVLHCLPGFWNAADLAAELQLAQKLSHIWNDKTISAVDKAALYKRMHLDHLAGHSEDLVARSHLQGFDAQHIYKNRAELADCISDKEAIKAVEDPHKLPAQAFKTSDRIMHERMSTQAFVSYDNFNTAGYTSYGCNHYDKGENEIEIEGSAPTLALKGKSLRTLTKPTVIAAIQASPTQPKDKSTAIPTPPELFVSLAKEMRWQEAFACADSYVKKQFNQPGGYEMRSLAALKLGLYKQAHDDASRALWLGSRHQSARRLRDLSVVYKNALSQTR
jgi:hypothetical protein